VLNDGYLNEMNDANDLPYDLYDAVSVRQNVNRLHSQYIIPLAIFKILNSF
jgi:hypothetical protein